MKRSDMKYTLLFILIILLISSCVQTNDKLVQTYSQEYSGDRLNRIAYPIGGMGAGMIALEGGGAFSHVSVRNSPNMHNSPLMFAAISVKGVDGAAKIIEGPVQDWKIFGSLNNGSGYGPFGGPRFEGATFTANFPFARIEFSDEDVPLNIVLMGWSPFTPLEPDESSLPVGGLEYTFTNISREEVDAVFSFHSENFMSIPQRSTWSNAFGDSIKEIEGGFVLSQESLPGREQDQGDFAIFTDDENVVVDHSWFRGEWSDPRTILWKDIEEGNMPSDGVKKESTGASLYVPIHLSKGESKTVKILLSWYVPKTNLNINTFPYPDPTDTYSGTYSPWYSAKFKSIYDVSDYWRDNYYVLRDKSKLFSETFYSSELPVEVIDAVAANLPILKSPTILRQTDGRLWGWEGSADFIGSCPGTCTHVWNYAQSLPWLFPGLERGLRETEFNENQNDQGHQNFRAYLPIREISPFGHTWHAAADGQLGGIMKVYRDWRISGNSEWLQKLWPAVKQSLDFCIDSWDPRHTGTLEEPHHNTYDIEFWGANGMTTSLYLGALKAAILISDELESDATLYNELFNKGQKAMNSILFNGEYYFQKTVWEGLNAQDPMNVKRSWNISYSDEAIEIAKTEGPKYQYGPGCLSDGVIGFWLARVCGLGDIINDSVKETSHLTSVYTFNYKPDLSDFANPQRSTYAYGHEGGLLLCTWPRGGKPTLPFVYSNEVWTGIEYQVASHLMMMGELEKGLDIVREARKRYNGIRRNPFNEYECGNWYARAMSSYSLIQGCTGFFYDKVNKVLFIDSRIGENFKCFFCAEDGFGLFGLRDGNPIIEMKYGCIELDSIFVSGEKFEVDNNLMVTAASLSQ